MSPRESVCTFSLDTLNTLSLLWALSLSLPLIFSSLLPHFTRHLFSVLVLFPSCPSLKVHTLLFPCCPLVPKCPSSIVQPTYRLFDPSDLMYPILDYMYKKYLLSNALFHSLNVLFSTISLITYEHVRTIKNKLLLHLLNQDLLEIS